MQQSKFPLKRLYFYLTEGCNLSCRHCWIAPKFQSRDKVFPSLQLDTFRSIIDEAKPLGLDGVKLTGGEPLLHPAIGDILDEVKNNDLSLTVETNGIICTETIAQKIKRCKNAFVSVSLDGSDVDTHEWIRGVKGSFNEAINGIKTLVKTGIRPQIVMTVMRRNKDQIEGVARLAESLGCGSVKINVLQYIERGWAMEQSGSALDIEELIVLGSHIENVLTSRLKIKILYHHPKAFRPLGRILGKDGDRSRCEILNILGVLSDGSYALCGIGGSVPELIFGTALKDKLKDVWENAPVLKILRQDLPGRLEGVCGKCLMKEDCMGNCIAQNYYKEKNLMASYWYCEEALALGLFPDSRLSIKSQSELAASE